MNVRVLSDTQIEIEGYVNAVERKSKPLKSRMGQFVERICAGAFKRAIERNDDIKLLLNHDWAKTLGGTKTGNLKLTEDSIGLRAIATVTDGDVVAKARNGELVGWSFGFTDRDVDSHNENGMPTRDVKDLNLYEVSILDRTRVPAYDGTLVTVRAEDDMQYHGEEMISDYELQETRETQPEHEETHEVNIDYSEFEEIIKNMKGE